ncbi:MAG: glycosyltransferase family 39 protein, partial [Chloroflexi bacterium]|nr:glycosyltransferase family 39 protein [Chloroflexota bacterium]
MTDPLLAKEGEQAATGMTFAEVWAQARALWQRFDDLLADRQVVASLLLIILALGAILRFTGLDWDNHQHLHPDERFLTMVENSLQWPKSLKEYFDTANNPLNPYNHGHGTYVYGLLPVVLAKALGELVGKTGYDGVYLVGRAMNSVLDLGSVLLVFLIGRRLYGVREGLMGALLLSMSVLNIQNAHFFTVDTSTTFFVTLALYFAVRVAQHFDGTQGHSRHMPLRSGWGSVLMLGVSFGLAVSAKISVLSFLLIIGLAYVLRVSSRWRAEDNAADDTWLNVSRRLGRLELSLRITPRRECGRPHPSERWLFWGLGAALSMLAVVLVAVLVFRVVQPQAFTGPGLLNFKLNPKWKDDMSYIQKLVSGEIDYPPSHQWTAREPIWYMLKNMVLWGLGLPLGLAVWGGWALMAYELYFKHKWAHLLPWVWMSFTFLYQSVQFVKTIRYLLPIYPTMAVIAGYGLVRLLEWARNRVRGPGAASSARWRWARVGAVAVVLLVVLGTAFWAFAFTRIYTRPVTRVAASRWIYANLPRGSTLSFELWDDPVPLNVDGHLASAEFKQIQMDLYWEDIPEKRERLYQALEELDYIILSSNRLYGSIPRLPMRYPLTTRYYEALFSGELGFERIKTFTSRPGLFGIEIVDDNADETFTVYDHPKVIIFKKRPDFSMEKVRAMLDVYDLERIVRVRPIQVTQAPNNLMLDEATWELQRRGGTWSELFDRNSLANKRPTLIWLLALYFVGLAATPLGFLAFRRLRDRGYILSKTLGILLLAYLPWLLASLRIVPYTRGAIWGCLLLIAAASGAVAWWQRRELGEFLRARWRLLAANELLFLGFFLLFWLIRLGNPDLWHPAMGGEKPMDLAYLNAIIKSSYFPPYDPWFAGGYINYYYFGWVTVASLIKLTGIVPTTAYNLAIPTYFSLLAMGACTVTFNLIPKGEEEAAATPWFPRALRFGLAGACLVAILGNLGEVELLLNGFKELGNEVAFKSSIPLLESLVRVGAGLWAFFLGGKKLPFRSEWWYWNASRIMDHGEINEFPFFSFLYADLHAHVTAMPFALLALALAVGLVLRPRAGMAQQGRPAEGEPSASIMRRIWARARELAARVDGALLVQLTLLGLTLGELWCNNSWDYPTYMGISLVALAIGLYHETRRIDQRSLTRLALQAGYLIALSMILFYPYHAHFGLGYSSVEPWKGERTSLGSYLLIHGPMLFILASYLLALAFRPDTRNGVARTLRLFWRSGDRRGRALELYERLVRCQTLGYEAAWGGLVLLGAVWLVLLLAKAWVLVVATPLAVLAIALTFYRRAQPAQRLQTFFVATGLLLTMAVEYIVLKGDIGRMNTVFKFYLQVWILWGVVGGAALAHLLPRTERWATMRARLWRTALALLLMGAGLYPILATWGKVRDRWNPLPPGLDGMAYMTKAQYHDNRPLTLEHDRRAIIWLQEHVVGSPVIVEANTPLYRWGNRVSIYTGLPAIIGWDWHQKQQRTAVSGVVVDWRLQDLNELYNTHDIVQATRLLDRYQVGLIYVGELEQAYYDPQGLAKFDDMVGSVLDVVYRQGPVTIYRVRGRCALIGEGETSGSRTALPTWWRRLRPSWIAGAVLAQGPEKRPSGDLIEAPPHEPLMLDVPVEEIASVDNRGWNGWGNVSTLGAVVSWWLILQLLGLATWPLLWAPFARFQDRGYGLAKGFGLLLASYLVWISSSLRLAANGPPMAWLAVVALGGGSFFLWRRRRRERDDLRALWQRSRRLLLLEEALFNASFLAFVGIRILNPDLWHPWFGGEKPMEIAYLNAITKSAYMPPYDPYFAGGYLNYYYFGQFIAGVLLKLTGIRPEVGFNLAVPT